MARPPRKPRPITRSTDVLDPAVTTRAVVPKPADPRQPDLFARPFIPPMLATLAAKVPAGERWQYEIKHDGYRVQAHVSAGQVRLYTRGGFDWTDRMPFIAVAISALRCQSAILDGEAVIEDEADVSDFFALHRALRGGRAPEAILYAFDLLELDGEDLRPMPLVQRRAMLAELLIGAPDGIEISQRALPLRPVRLLGQGEVHQGGALRRDRLRSVRQARRRGSPDRKLTGRGALTMRVCRVRDLR
jgi:bifunctional non-homologous end joining protein LigD